MSLCCILDLILCNLLPRHCNAIEFKDNSTGEGVDHEDLRRNVEERQRVSKISDDIFIQAVDCHRHRGGVEKAAHKYHGLVQYFKHD